MKINFVITKSILLLSFLSLLCYSPKLKAQNPLSVSGKVTDQNAKGLEGVTVQVKETLASTVTTADGSFRIQVPNSNSVLIFSYVGFATQEISINGRSALNVSLSLDAKGLDEVVVIGYGTQKRRNVTGAVSSFDARKLENVPF